MDILMFMIILGWFWLQHFPANMYGTSMGDKDTILSSFPSFNIGDTGDNLGYMVYGDLMIGYTRLTIGRLAPHTFACPATSVVQYVEVEEYF